MGLRVATGSVTGQGRGSFLQSAHSLEGLVVQINLVLDGQFPVIRLEPGFSPPSGGSITGGKGIIARNPLRAASVHTPAFVGNRR
jgi:hypothetical protein